MKKNLQITSLFLGLLAACTAYAADHVLTLQEAERLWQHAGYDLKLADTVVSGAEADVLQAGQRLNPTFSFNVSSYSPSQGWGGGTMKDKRADSVVRLDQTIEMGGKRDLRVQGAEARLAAARQDRRLTGNQQRLALQLAYHELHQAQDRWALAKETASLYGESLAAADKRQKAGDLAPVDLTRLSIDKARADNELETAGQALVQAQQLLSYLLGGVLENETVVAGDAWPAQADKPLVLPGLDTFPAVIAAQHRLKAAESARDLARASRSRDVTVGVQYERNPQDVGMVNTYGVGVSIPLFVWHANEGEIARAETELHAARLAYEQTRLAVQRDMEIAQKTVSTAQTRLQRLENGLLADALRVAKAAEFAYTKGAMSLLELLDARRTLRQVQMEAVDARADHAKALAAWVLLTDAGNQSNAK